MQIKKIDNATAEVKLYGMIGAWFTNGDEFTCMLEEVEANGYKNLVIREHCYGGSVFEGNVMYNALDRSKLNITVIIEGVAASMGCFILPSVANVHICDNAFGMIHRPTSSGGGNADDHRNEARLLDSMEANFIKRLSERAGMSEADVKAKWLDGGTHWLNADEMVQYGFATKKINATAKNIKELDKEIAATMGEEKMFARFAAQLITDYSTKKNKMDKSTLIAAFALKGVTAESTDAEVLAALKNAFSTMENRIKELEDSAKAKTDAEITALLESVPKGSFNEDELKELRTIGEKAGVNALRTALKKQSVQVPDITAMVKSEDRNAFVTKNWEWYQKNDPKALEKMATEHPEQFAQLYKAEYGCLPA